MDVNILAGSTPPVLWLAAAFNEANSVATCLSVCIASASRPRVSFGADGLFTCLILLMRRRRTLSSGQNTFERLPKRRHWRRCSARGVKLVSNDGGGGSS